MKPLLSSTLALALTLGCTRADHHQEKPAHPPFPAEGFNVIFDGQNLDKIKTGGNWQIRDDGTLELVSRPGEKGWERYGSYLWLPGEYADFIVDFEFKYQKGGNSGLYFRISDDADATASGWEVQILDSFDNRKPLIHHDMGGIIKTSPALENASLPPGEWNRMTVALRGSDLQVILNGKLVQDFDLAEKKPNDKQLAAKGKIAIQDHGQPFWVRNIQIRSLD